MIGYLTKKFFRAYIMISPRIVLLFLGLVTVICEAGNVLAPSSLTYNEAKGELTCEFALNKTKNGLMDECYKGETTDCVVIFETVGISSEAHKGKNENDRTWKPTINGKYCCKASKGISKSHDCTEADKEVENLPKRPSVDIEPKDTKDRICGKDVTITCTAGKDDKVVQRLIIRDTSSAGKPTDIANGPVTDGKFVHKVPATSSGSFVCVASSKTATDGLMSISSASIMSCTKGSDDSGAPDLGRPASLLTIVCSLLALTLSLRG